MKTYFRLLAFAKPYSSFIPKYIVVAILAVIFGLVNFTLLIPLLNVIFNQTPPELVQSLPAFSLNLDFVKGAFNYYFSKIFIEYGRSGALQFVCIIIVISVFLSNLFKYWSQRILTKMRTNVIRRIRSALFDKILNLHVGYFQDQRKGDLMSSLSNDVTEIEVSVVSSVQVIFREPLMIAGYIILLFTMSVKLTLFTMLVLPVSGFIISRISKSLKRQAVTGQELLGNILSIIEETISGARIIKAFNAQHYTRNKFEDQNGAYRNLIKSMWNKREMASPVSEFLGVTVVVGVLLYGGQLVLENNSDLNASEFITYIVLFSQVLVPAKAISSAVTNIQRGIASGERIFKILETEVPIKEVPQPIQLDTLKEAISFNEVSFSYDQERKVLNKVSLVIPKGKMIALVGQSGAGKTTMADLLPRYYDVTEGSITIDGNDIRQLSLNSLNQLMGIVTQESILFNDTVFNNIAFGTKGLTEQAVIEAAKIANAHEFITQMENGYQSNIGDRGGKLSGGQRQRLSIARAVLKNPPILILDEATSALDTESERLVQEAIQNLMKNRTSIVIAHRLSTIQHADLIVVMQQGEIIERGTHAELIAANGAYKKLTDMQTFL
ncbi:MAG: ABC transporter ATP-binding protein/permease [Bacteroidia bacterium]|jgi:subfamily B ATP-binding cassette protein MsbA|nr:ABC transporter ATP-binding protein/permease [Bacteroidia bacterium]